LTRIQIIPIFAAASETRQTVKKVRSFGIFKYKFPATGNNKSSLKGEKNYEAQRDKAGGKWKRKQ
jgi:hypothetical protein